MSKLVLKAMNNEGKINYFTYFDIENWNRSFCLAVVPGYAVYGFWDKFQY